MERLITAIAALGLLAACAKTTIEVSYDDGNGKVITASYSSGKDIAAPSFELVRDEQGRVQSIRLSAENADASTPQAAYNQAIGSVVEGAVRGALGAAGRAVPGASYTPADLQRLQALIWYVNGRTL